MRAGPGPWRRVSCSRPKGFTDDVVDIRTKGGEIVRVYATGDVYLEGSARVIYEGTLWPEALEYARESK